jgi:hypothetical protein
MIEAIADPNVSIAPVKADAPSVSATIPAEAKVRPATRPAGERMNVAADEIAVPSCVPIAVDALTAPIVADCKAGLRAKTDPAAVPIVPESAPPPSSSLRMDSASLSA